jgi:hypothetical protein
MGMDALELLETEKIWCYPDGYKYAFDEWFETTKRIRQKALITPEWFNCLWQRGITEEALSLELNIIKPLNQSYYLRL